VNETIPGRVVPPTQRETRRTAGNAALLIDFDNVTMGIRSDLQHQLRELLNSAIIKGKVAVQRAYADWRRYPQYIVPLSEASIDLIFAPAFGSNKKNATDIRLAIDALELVFTRPEIGTFILLSGDSDFSSLVLKLKEYGKWVIGVGIRESASDLLVQNCDEYYSYAELTGFAKEGEVEVLRRDPWELVVEATLGMKESGDTMRSDRLKQVMQQLDPHFDEKDAGYNRFSKFVLEAGRRKLLALEKLETGQYEIKLGSDANVPPDRAVQAEVFEKPAEAKPSKKSSRASVEEAAGGGALMLANAFALLKRTLVDLEAVGENATNSKAARGRMAEMADDANDPIFEPRRFSRMLRQARDAKIIDLVKDGRSYALKLLPEAMDDEGPEPEPKPSVERQKRTRTKKGSRKKPVDEAAASAPPAEEPAAPPAPPKPDPGPSPEAKSKPRKRSLRGRGSSRSRDAKPKPAVSERPSREPAPESKPRPEPEPEVEVVLPRAIPTRRSVRGRGSSRGRRPQPRPEAQTPAEKSPPGGSESPERETVSGRRTPKTGGLPQRRKQSSDREEGSPKGQRPRSRGQRRATTNRPSADSRARPDGDGGGQEKGGRQMGGSPSSRQGQDTRPSRETKAASSLIEKRVVPEEPKSGGILQRMMQRLRGEEKDD
jgi:uncharacterized protein (TIGR00288 family)